MKLKCNEEELLAIQDIIYYSLKLETCIFLSDKYPYEEYLCNHHLHNAYTIFLQFYLSKLEKKIGYVKWRNANKEILKQINIYFDKKENQYHNIFYKEYINESIKIELENDEIMLSLDDIYFFNLEYDAFILGAFTYENIDNIQIHYEICYKNVDLNQIKNIYKNMFLYAKTSDYIIEIIKKYRKVEKRIWST